MQAAALIQAALAGNEAAVSQMLTGGVAVDAKDSRGLAALHVAAVAGRTSVMRQLLSASASVDIGNQLGETPLLLASKAGQLMAAKLLVEAGANVNACSANSLTPLQASASGGHVQVLKFLLEAGANSDNSKLPSPLHMASTGGHLKIIDILLLRGANPNQRQNYLGLQPLHCAAQHGHTAVIDRLLSVGAQVDSQTTKGWTPVVYAAINGHCSALARLLLARADTDVPTETGDCALHESAFNGRTDIIVRLLDAKVNVDLINNKGETAMLRAAQVGHVDIVKRLISASANVDAASTSGETALTAAARIGSSSLVSALLAAGANPRHRNLSGVGALGLAAQNEHHKVFRLLLAANPTEEELARALEAAVFFGHRKVLRELSAMECFDRQLCLLLSKMRQQLDFESRDAIDVSNFRTSIETTRQGNKLSDENSAALYNCLAEAGFVRSRSLVQSSLAQFMENIVGEATFSWRSVRYFIVGSLADGWGNSLVSLSGGTDPDSDIDATQLYSTDFVYHIRGYCKCDCKDEERLEYRDGHIITFGASGSPAQVEMGSAVRPALDLVNAYRCCCYPKIAVLEPGYITNIPQPVLQSLRNELLTSTCHVVCAAAPGQEGRQLRVSTTFLERCLMRNLSTEQGQLFVILKYIVKKVISKRAKGLKTYNAKTLLFRMLDETPPDDWTPDRLVPLTGRAIERLIKEVQDGRLTEHQSGWHFFLPDATLYLRGGHEPKERIVQELQRVLDELPRTLEKFARSLQPLGPSSTYQMQILLLCPHGHGFLSSSYSIPGLMGIFYTLRDLFLSAIEKSRSIETLLSQIDRVPDTAISARRCLRVLALLSNGDTAEAERALHNGWGAPAVRGVSVHPNCELSPDQARALVQSHFGSPDCVTKFCFTYLDRPPVLQVAGLPFVSETFPKRLRNFQGRQVFVNFDALLRAIGLELLQLNADSWFDELTEENADVQELQVALKFCTDVERLSRLISRHSKVIASDADLSDQALRLMKARPDLFERQLKRFFGCMYE